MNASISANTANIPFKLTNAWYNSIYDPVVNKFYVPEKSLYWFQLSVGIPAGSTASYQLNGLTNSVAISSTATMYPKDRLTIDSLQWVEPYTALSVSTNKELYSSRAFETSFLGIRLDKILNSCLVAFAVKISEPVTAALGTVNFNQVLVNEGNAYDTQRNVFTAPADGAYFLTMTSRLLLYLKVNNELKLVICVCDDIHGSAITPARASVMLSLQKNDVVQITGPTSYSSALDAGSASFQGFLYNPKGGVKVAWSVAKTVSGNNFAGPIDYMPYNIVYTNINSAWKTDSNKVIIPVTGTYVVDLYSYLCGKGWIGDGNSEQNVLLNGQPIIVNKLSPITFNNCVSRSSSTIVYLFEGDELRVKIPTAGGFYADDQRMQTFSGFLLHQ